LDTKEEKIIVIKIKNSAKCGIFFCSYTTSSPGLQSLKNQTAMSLPIDFPNPGYIHPYPKKN